MHVRNFNVCVPVTRTDSDRIAYGATIPFTPRRYMKRRKTRCDGRFFLFFLAIRMCPRDDEVCGTFGQEWPRVSFLRLCNSNRRNDHRGEQTKCARARQLDDHANWKRFARGKKSYFTERVGFLFHSSRPSIFTFAKVRAWCAGRVP